MISISLYNVKKSFPDGSGRLEVLKGIDLEIQKGEMVAIMGRSGCGKSTLLNIIGLLMKPDEGNYHIMEQSVNFSSARETDQLRREHLGIVLQHPALIKRKTAKENIILPLKGSFSKKIIEQKVTDLLEDLELWPLRNKYPDQLSGGEKQRVSIARAMIHQPDILLADEPSGALDAQSAQNVISLLHEIRNKNGTSIVLATHDKTIAAQCDRILLMDYGKIRAL